VNATPGADPVEVTVERFLVRTDLAYDLGSHIWVQLLDDGTVRLGLDPLGVETSGTLSQFSFEERGPELDRGQSLGTLEAEKFVGPLAIPVAGRVVAVNEAVVADPGLVHRDPYGEGWLAVVDPVAIEADLERLVRGPDAVVAAFTEKIAAYRIEGVLAE
jgi:glycine cleavage system H protein